MNAILSDLAGGELLGSRADVDGCLKELTAELAGAMSVSPGLERRAAYVEKEHRELEESLAQELRRRGSEADVGLMRELLYGGDALAPGSFGRDDSQLRWVPASNVADGAKLLAEVELSEETHGISDSVREQYREWKNLIITAAAWSEAIMVFPTG